MPEAQAVFQWPGKMSADGPAGDPPTRPGGLGPEFDDFEFDDYCFPMENCSRLGPDLGGIAQAVTTTVFRWTIDWAADSHSNSMSTGIDSESGWAGEPNSMSTGFGRTETKGRSRRGRGENRAAKRAGM